MEQSDILNTNSWDGSQNLPLKLTIEQYNWILKNFSNRRTLKEPIFNAFLGNLHNSMQISFKSQAYRKMKEEEMRKLYPELNVVNTYYKKKKRKAKNEIQD